jgi:predicted dithiol-disulfide oxidoreductase (DUF899 family)
MTARTTTEHPVVPREEWLRARTALLAREKELTRARDELARARRALPWVAIPKPYRFHARDGERSLAELFGTKSQLIVYHFMLGPDWTEGCASCSFLCDHVDGARVHFEQRDVAFVAVSRAPLEQIEPFRRRMGWRFPWVSSHGSDFNRDFHVALGPENREKGTFVYNYRILALREDAVLEDFHGISVFAKDAAGRVYHTYSTYARGAEPFLGAYAWLDLVPKGRDEDDLDFGMTWVRHHDRYDAE